jgi:hypothetical protein
LNYQGFKNGLPERRVNSFMFRQPIRYTPEINPSDRYWNVIPILRRAIKDRILKKGVILPDWVSESISNMKEKKKATVDDLDAVIFGLKNGKVMRPKVLKVESILSLDQEEASGIRYQVFKELIKAGIKWTTLELINSWEYFKISFRRNNPSMFWSFIKDVRASSLQYANDMLAVEKEDTGSEVIGFSENRTFAKNLFLRMKDEHTWDISNEEYIPFDCSDTLEPEDEKIPMEKLLLSRIDKRKIDISKLAENEDDLFDLQDALEAIDSHNHASVFGFVEASPDEELLDKEIDPIDGSTHYRFGEDKDSSD